MKKIGIFGCKSTTQFLIESLRDRINIECVITIPPEKGEKCQVADYKDLTPYCEKNDINFYQVDLYNLKSEKDKENIENMSLDVAFVIGWQRLIPKEILETFSIGAFGMHVSTDDLPIGRGRSPMNWALIERRNHFFTNLFKYDAGVDSGDILDTFVFSIQPTDTSETMHFKNVLAMKALIFKNIDKLISVNYSLKRQKDVSPTYYPKRTPKDSLIDWGKDIFQIEAFIRAVTHPFNGAFSYINDEKIIIWRAAIFETDLVKYGYNDVEWGIIVEVFPSCKFLVKCRGGLLIVHNYDADLKIEKGMRIQSPYEELPLFALNEYGYHDLDDNS